MPTSLTQNDSVLYIINLDIAITELSFKFVLIDHLLGNCTENCICLERKYQELTQLSLSHKKAEVASPEPQIIKAHGEIEQLPPQALLIDMQLETPDS